MNDHERRSMLCPNCGRLISRDESVCPWCGTGHPGSWMKNNIFIRSLGDVNVIVFMIVATNVVIYLISLMISQHLPGQWGIFTSLSPDRNSLFLLGATGVVPIERHGRFWTLLSASYLHGGPLHILFNMMALRRIMPMVAQEYGSRRMFTIYTLGGVSGYVVSYLAGIGYTIGASAAICGLIGSLLY